MERTKPSRRLRNGGLFLERFVSSGRLEGWELSTLLLPQFLRWIYGTCTVPSSAQSLPAETPQHMSLPAKTSFNSHHQFSSFSAIQITQLPFSPPVQCIISLYIKPRTQTQIQTYLTHDFQPHTFLLPEKYLAASTSYPRL